MAENDAAKERDKTSQEESQYEPPRLVFVGTVQTLLAGAEGTRSDQNFGAQFGGG